MDLKGKTFIISGGGSGLGRGAAQVLVEGGAQVVLADVNAANAEKTAEELGSAARFTECDVTNEAQVQTAVDLAFEAFGGLNGVVNCAGIAAAQRVSSKAGPHPLDLWKLVLDINLTGSFNLIRLAASAMVAKQQPDPQGERGVLINTASVAAFEGQIGQAAYAASKGGVVSMTLPIAREFAKFGIRCVTIAPGLFDTPMFGVLPDEARESLGGQVPFPSRLGDPREFGGMVRHVAENIMLNGETIRLDGAVRMQAK